MPIDGHFTPQMQVNSANQLWSRWVFGVQADPDKLPTIRECMPNFRRWVAKGFKSRSGRCRIIKPSVLDYEFEVQIEGPPAHDPEYRGHVKRQFIEHFMFAGFGHSSRLVRYDVDVMAGDKQDGTPAEQMIVMPSIRSLISEYIKGRRNG